jgi:hypothetical protein
MQLTIEENERAAYAQGNTALATAWGRIIDLEQERLQLRQFLREAYGELTSEQMGDDWFINVGELIDLE